MKLSAGQVERHVPPISSGLASELLALWDEVFQGEYSATAKVLAGKDSQANSDIFYVARKDGRVVGTSHLTIARADPRIGGLGEVVTAPKYRRRGIGRLLCTRAAEEFETIGGEGLFLGSGDLVARELYRKLGWQALANSNVMVRVSSRDTPEGFLEDYFARGKALPVSIIRGSSSQRVTMIPVILAGRDWVVLDANVRLFSTRAKVQTSCMSLYPRYEAIGDSGVWFVAARDDGAVVGLASVKQIDAAAVQIDGFSHAYWHPEGTRELYLRAIDWAQRQGVAAIRTVCAEDDTLKLSVLKELKMHPTGERIQVGDAEDSITALVFEMR